MSFALNACRMALPAVAALGFVLWQHGLMKTAGAQDQQDLMPCRVQQGQTTVAVGNINLSACLRIVYARAGSGTWGSHRIEIEHGGRVQIDGQPIGLLRPHDGSLDDFQRR
jgi:hypothetical protein